MKLQQGQMWKKGNDYVRIVHWERLAIEYKLMEGTPNRRGKVYRVTKKEFCRMLQGAELLVNAPAEDAEAEDEEELVDEPVVPTENEA
jgi:hypothetical protein